ncbi:hypothetical protein I79_009681 [Cricetulus griseus]|uniref:Uncharacterized protein n=1 Tax=Cricetulus griseus TaxID=10029 RepID=G3HGF5_CRIGR|nr:hypothetical protein I79_009681 [Cricetulus griseus]
MMKHHDQKQHGEERIYLTYVSTPQFIIKGNQCRNSSREGTEAGADGEAKEECFLTEPRTTSPGVLPPMCGH